MTQIYALPEIPRDQNAAESWETLEADLIELSQLVTDFSLLVNSQQEKIDSIEDHVNSAAANVEEGTRRLGKVRLCSCRHISGALALRSPQC
ncbi:STX17 [Cervus elaphus hippelaphus]|uniref:Syntaxin-17 n=1 Tax=Cervus elaphus hippelaphus TaxID=46360 RepID=A0A212CMS9_CEREH|nr:STX17 [Cervus elaphus hippelaphus]